MNKYLAIILGLFIIAGCTPSENTGGSSTTPFIGGTTGLIINFQENAPPTEVTDGGQFPFSIIVNLENAGEYTIPADRVDVKITGLYPQDFGAGGELRKTPTENLDGVTKDSEGNKISGAIREVEFQNLNYLGKLQGNLQLPIRAEVCYPYETRASTTYCMLSNLLSTEDRVCDINGPKTVYNSGAPVQVTTMTESVSGSNSVLFNIKVSHKGNGNIYRADTTCAPLIQNQNKVWVQVNSGLGGLKCQNLQEKGSDETSGYLRLVNGEATFTCTQTTTNVDAAKEMTLNLRYDYKDIKNADLLVKHIG